MYSKLFQYRYSVVLGVGTGVPFRFADYLWHNGFSFCFPLHVPSGSPSCEVCFIHAFRVVADECGEHDLSAGLSAEFTFVLAEV